MNKLKKAGFATVALTTAVSLMMAGCGGTSNTSNNATNSTTGATGTPKDGGTMTISQFQPFDNTFLPTLSSVAYTGYIWPYAFDPLFTLDKNYNVVNDLASSYVWSPDHTTLTINLNKKAVWSDGQPIVSADVLLYLDFLASKAYNTTFQGQYESYVDDIKGASDIVNGTATSFANTGGFEQVSDKEFKIHFAKKNAHEILFNVLFWYPLPSHVLKNIPFSQWQNAAYDRKPTVVSGAYTFNQVNGTDTVVMKANPKYLLGKPHIDTVIWKTVNTDVAPGQLQNNQIDYMLNGLQPTDVGSISSFSNVTVHHPIDQGYYYLGLKDNSVYFKDVRVRQAFTYAINREAIVKGVVKGYGNVANGPLTPAQWGYTTQGMNTYDYNKTKATDLLTQAGWTKGSDGFLKPPGATSSTISLGYPSSDPQRTAAALQIAQDLKAIGVNVKLIPYPKSSGMYDKVQSGEIQMWMGGWLNLGAYQDIKALWRSDMAYNAEFQAWKDPKNDALIDDAYSDKAYNQSYYKQTLIKWEQYVNQQMPIVFLWDDDLLTALNNRVQISANDWQGGGFQPINPQNWWLQ